VGGGGTGLPLGLNGGRWTRSGGRTSGEGAVGTAGGAAGGADGGAAATGRSRVSLGVTDGVGGSVLGGALVAGCAAFAGTALAGAAGAEAAGALETGAGAGRLLIKRGARGSTSGVVVGAVSATFLEADLAAAAFLAGSFAGASGSSGWTSRRNPSASALRRTRSAWASSMEDEWLLTPIPRERASSSPSLLLRPSSLASS